jgi:hypothetical protein
MEQIRKRKRRRSTPPEIVRFIQDRRIDGESVSRIQEALETADEFEGRVLPSPRTIRSIAAEVAPQDKSGPWSFVADRTGRPDLVLPCWAAVIEANVWTNKAITNGEADWIVRLRKAAPSLPPLEAWRMSRRCIAADTTGRPVADLEEWLAFEAWTREGQQRIKRVMWNSMHRRDGGNEL